MEHKSWADQPVTRRKTWLSRVVVVNDFAEYLPTFETDLETTLQDTRAAIKHDRTTTVIKLALPTGDFVLKRYNPRSLWHKVKRALRRSRALRCWRMSYAFERAGLNVARPIMMVEKRFGPVRRTAYFMNEMLDGHELLISLPTMEPAEQAAVRDAILEAFAKMRAAKLTHGDMKASNLIWDDGKLFFIDLDAALKHRSDITWRNSHVRDRRRFLKNWQEDPQLLSLFEALR